MKIFEECVMCTGKHVLMKKVYKWVKHRLSTMNLNKKEEAVYGVETYRLSGKENVLCQVVNKERDSDNLLEYERTNYN